VTTILLFDLLRIQLDRPNDDSEPRKHTADVKDRFGAFFPALV
jgi:hypothetical protein